MKLDGLAENCFALNSGCHAVVLHGADSVTRKPVIVASSGSWHDR
jgi:hypothetical protein